MSNWISYYLKLNGYCKKEESYKRRLLLQRKGKLPPGVFSDIKAFGNELKLINKHIEEQN
jgi:hypothetical protein